MNEKNKNSAPDNSAFRIPNSELPVATRYRPKRDISPVIFSVIPWINIIVLVAAFVFFTQSKAVVPGIRVALPAQPFHDGMQGGLKIVAKNIPGDEASAAEEEDADDGATVAPMHIVVFFNDTRFNLTQPYRIASFRNNVADAIAKNRDRHDAASALVYMDTDVSHGDAIRLTGLLRDTGITNVCFVVKTK